MRLKFTILILLFYSAKSFCSDNTIYPVSPNSSTEAKALLKFLYSTSGNYILTGQHNFPNIKGRNTQFAAEYIGKTPLVYSTDWGFAKDSDTDSYLARPDIVKKAIELNKEGYIITICWHAVPPTANEPITFRPRTGKVAPDSLASVQGQLLDQQFQDVLTPGTYLYKKWCSQVDTIAKYLKELQAAHVPIIWRPYHEMNGSWFWWGGRTGKYSSRVLYTQLFNRLTHYHKINNLIWVWNVDRPHNDNMQFSKYNPGEKYFDIASIDIYGNDFNQLYYDSLLNLSKGKLITLGEVGNPPSPEIMKMQPKWSYYVIWAGMVRNTNKNAYKALLNDPRYLWLGDSAYCKLMVPYRMSCNLLPLKENIYKPNYQKPNFTGEWIFNEESSKLDKMGVNGLPYKLNIVQKGNDFMLQKSYILEYAEDKVTTDNLKLDGSECKSEFMKSPMIIKAHWQNNSDTLIIESDTKLQDWNKPIDIFSNEQWILNNHGKVITIIVNSKAFKGEQNYTMVFDKN